MSNNSKTFSAPTRIWDNESGLGTTISKRHMSMSPIAYNQQKSGHLRRNRVSLSDYLSRRLHKNHASILSSRDLFVARSFSSAPFEYPMVGGESHSNFQPTYANLSPRIEHKPADAASSGVSIQENNANKSTLVQAKALPGRNTTTLDYRLTPAEAITKIPAGKTSLQPFTYPSPASANSSVNSLDPVILRKEKTSDVDDTSTFQNLISRESHQTKNLHEGKNDINEINGIRIREPLTRIHRSIWPSIYNFDRPLSLQRHSLTSFAQPIQENNANKSTRTLVQARALPKRNTTTLNYRLTPAETITKIPAGKPSVQSFTDPSPASVNSSVNSLNPVILRKEKASHVDDASAFQKQISRENHQKNNLYEGKNDVNEITGIRIQGPMTRAHKSNWPSINNFDRPFSLQRHFTSLARHIVPENRLNTLKQEDSAKIDRRVDSVNTFRFLEANTQNAPISLSNLSSNISLAKPDLHEASKERFYADQPAGTDDLGTLQRKAHPDSGNARSTDAENLISDKNSVDKNSFASRAFDLTGDSVRENSSLLPINFTSRSPQRKRNLSAKDTDTRQTPFFEHQISVSRNERAAHSAYRSILMRDSAAAFRSHPDSEAFGTKNIDSGKIAHARSKTSDRPVEFMKPGEPDISSVAESLMISHAHHPINNPVNRKNQAASDIFSMPDRNISFTSNQRDIAEQKHRYWPASSHVASGNNPIKPLSVVQRQFAPLAMNNNPGHSSLARRNSNGQALSILRKRDSNNLSPAMNVSGILPLQSHSSAGQFTHLSDIDSAAAFINQKSSRLIQKQDQMPSLGSSGDHTNSINEMMRPGHVFHESMSSIKIPAGRADFIVNSKHSDSTGSMLNRSLLALPGRQISRVVIPSSPSAGNQNDLLKPVTAAYLNTRADTSIVQRKENSLHSDSAGSKLNRSLPALPGRQISRVVIPSSPSTGNQNDLPEPVTAAYLDTQGDTSIVQRKENSLASQFFPLPLSTGANLDSKVGKYLSSGVLQRTFAEGRKSFQTQRHVSDINRLPLAQHFSIQRFETEAIKENFHDHNPTYIQREGGAPAHPDTSMTVSTPSLQNNSQTTNTEQNHLSQDDLVDKVWRKIMRKMASEQERMGGCSRWA